MSWIYQCCKIFCWWLFFLKLFDLPMYIRSNRIRPTMSSERCRTANICEERNLNVTKKTNFVYRYYVCIWLAMEVLWAIYIYEYVFQVASRPKQNIFLCLSICGIYDKVCLRIVNGFWGGWQKVYKSSQLLLLRYMEFVGWMIQCILVPAL